MNISFHYKCIRVLAESAGFDSGEAETIAYASQYVDNATEHKPITITDLPTEAGPRIIDGVFEPVCTAHESLQYFTQWRSKAAQLKVYICFHFLPARPFVAGTAFDFVVRPNTEIARSLAVAALGACAEQSVGSSERIRQLVRAGIALHSFADTWAHQGFSGRHSTAENDVSEREYWDGSEWTRVSWAKSVALDIAPDVGHAEVETMPDASNLRFRYRRASNNELVERDNPADFLVAAQSIYELMCECTGAPKRWADCKHDIEYCLLNPSAWETRFSNIFRERGYDRLAWRRSALEGHSHDWDRMKTADEFAKLKYTAGQDKRWFYFHVEAAKQRRYVLERIAGAEASVSDV